MLQKKSVPGRTGAVGNLRLEPGRVGFWNGARKGILRAMFEEGATDREIGERLGKSTEVVESARIRMGLRRPQLLQMPADFAEVAPALQTGEAARLWRVSDNTIYRWHRACGTKPRSRVYKRSTPELVKPAPTAPILASKQRGHNAFVAWPVPPVPANVVDRAAHHLRRHFPQVCRLRTLRGCGPDDVWVVGTMEVHASKIVKLAERHGFNPLECAA